MMRVLVDYDNIPPAKRNRGLEYLVDRTVRLLGYSILEKEQRVNVRLYGGWYELNRPTKTAQDIAARIDRSFPRPFIVLGSQQQTHTVTVSVDLAYSLAVEPSKHLWHTYRPRGLPPRLVCKPPWAIGCNMQVCSLAIVYRFFNDGCCPTRGCDTTPDDLLQIGQQKLVDTMLTVDLLHYASAMNDNVCIITSDDDLWPGIASAVVNGRRIVHIHTGSKRSTRRFYVPGIKQNYVEMNL